MKRFSMIGFIAFVCLIVASLVYVAHQKAEKEAQERVQARLRLERERAIAFEAEQKRKTEAEQREKAEAEQRNQAETARTQAEASAYSTQRSLRQSCLANCEAVRGICEGQCEGLSGKEGWLTSSPRSSCKGRCYYSYNKCKDECY